jgi:glycosyltransferase involved in cell wall biosynthesis
MEQLQLASVVIPAYNAEVFIDDAVKSCVTQTRRPLEVIVVNDGSTDFTVKRVNRLADSYSDSRLELRVIDVGVNKGAANALNLGFSNAEGDYICWLSADDIFLDREKVGRQVDYMNRTGASWSYYRDVYLGGNRHDAVLARSSYLHTFRALDPLFLHSSDLRLMALLFKNPINGSSVMIRRECVKKYGQFDPVTRNVDPDGDLWMRYSALNLKLAALSEAPVFYREHAVQTSKRKQLMLRGCEMTRMRMLLTLERKGSLTKLIAKFAPFLPVIFQTKYHFERPLVTEFLLNYISSHTRDLAPVRMVPFRRYLRAIKKHKNYQMIDSEAFYRDLKSFSSSQEYRAFESVFMKQ